MAGSLLSSSAGIATTYCTLAVFFFATVLFTCVQKSKGYDEDRYMSARNSQSTLALMLSFFASGAGAWILFAVPEAAILGGTVALVGYCVASVVPLLVFAWMAPRLRKSLPWGITFFEYVQQRYGSAVNAYVVLSSLFYMFLYLSAEFTSVGQSVDLLCGAMPVGDLQGPGLSAVVGTSLVTLFYTAYGGLPVSLITDRVQAVGMIITCVLVTIAACVTAIFPAPAEDTGVNHTALEQLTAAHANWQMATSWGIGQDPGHSWSMFFVLILAITSANVLHTGFQQRIWAAKDDAAVRHGLFGASLLTIPFMLLFGCMGMISFARHGFDLVDPNYLAFLSAFWLLHELPAAWHVLGIVLAISMVASSCDTIQAGITAMLHPMTAKVLSDKTPDVTPMTAHLLNFGLTALINVPAILLSTLGVSVLTLFVLADLLCATCVVPVIMGLWPRIHPTSALVGCLVGLLTALVTFGVGVNGEAGEYVVLLRPGGLYADTSLVAFILTPLCSTLAVLLANVPHFKSGYVFEGYQKRGTTITKADEAPDTAASRA